MPSLMSQPCLGFHRETRSCRSGSTSSGTLEIEYAQFTEVEVQFVAQWRSHQCSGPGARPTVCLLLWS